MKANYRNAVWYLCTLTAIIFTVTILFTIQGAPLWGWLFTVTTSVLQFFGFSYYLHRDPKKQEPKLLKVFLFLLRLSVLAVVGLLTLAVYSLASQYHNPVQATAEGENITIIQTENLNIMYPQYDTVEFVSGTRPKRTDKHITYCSGATFQKTYNILYTHDEIAATHVENGELYHGYSISGVGAFAFYDGTFCFANSEEAESVLQTAAEHGGWGFQEYMVIDDGEIVCEPANEYRCFRVLAELDGKLCVIDSQKQIDFHDFAASVQALGVTHALYLDMGSGWNYSWYRDNNKSTKTLIGLPWPFSHNWLVFKTADN